MRLFLCMCAIIAIVMSDNHLETALRNANSKITTDMLQQVVKTQGDRSFIMSAFSVLSPLALLSEGSTGETQYEILQAISFPNKNFTNDVFKDFNNKLKSVKGVELKQANKVYIRKGYLLNEKFASVSKEVFNSEVENVNFNEREQTAKKINTWVEDNTNKKIKNLIDPNSLNSNTAAILVNALYFKGKWKTQFKKEQTKERMFYVNRNKKITIPMMFLTSNFKYSESQKLDAKILEMPYDGNDTSLIVVLPNKIDGITELITKLNDLFTLTNELSGFSQKVQVYLPKFKIETTIDLKDVLQKIGIKKLFSPSEARLNNLIKGTANLFISDAKQKAFIEVNEEGTEAAAANQMSVQFRSVSVREDPKVFNADHPFVFFLKYKNFILFMGILWTF